MNQKIKPARQSDNWSLKSGGGQKAMPLLRRRILYCLFFLIFFITAPIVLLWAQGYHYNFQKHRLEKTGVLFLESKPTKAEIYLNGKLQTEKTETRLKNLLPDSYEVMIKKDGYQSWQKNLTVRTSETTFAQYIRLFKQEPVLKNLLPFKITALSQPQKDLVALAYEDDKIIKVALLNLETDAIEPLAELNFIPTILEISPRQNFILVSNNKQNLVIDLKNKKLYDLNKIIQKQIIRLKWTSFDRDENLYFLSAAGLKKIDLISFNVLSLITEPLIDWQIINNDIYYLAKTKNQVALKKTNFSQLQTAEILNLLPLSKNYTFEKAPENYLAILDNQNKIFYWLNLISQEKIKVFSETEYVKWFATSEQIMLGNEFEIALYDFKKNEENLILRLSGEIKDSAFYVVPTHIYFVTADGLKIIETTLQEKIMTVLVQKPGIEKIFSNLKGEKVYFSDENGLNAAEIQ